MNRERERRERPRRPAPAPAAGARPPAQVGALLALQRTAGNHAVARLVDRPMLARYSGHPLAEALRVPNAQAARTTLGEPVFQTLSGWVLRDLEPVLYHGGGGPAAVGVLQQLATNFAGVAAGEMNVLIGDLAPAVGVPALVALTPAQARWLRGHVAHAALAQAMLAAVGGDPVHAEAVMQFLAPYRSDATRLTIAQQELARFAYDVTLAQGEMDVLARYNFDRSLRTQTENKAQNVAAAELAGATNQAAAQKTIAYQAAAAAETQYVEQHRPPPPKKANKATKASKDKEKKAQQTFVTAQDTARQTRAQAELQADAAELAAVQTATQQVPVTTARVKAEVEQFVATTTSVHGEAVAKFVVETVGFELAPAAVVLGLFTALGARQTEARAHAQWAFAAYGADLPRLTRAITLLTAADAAHLTVPEAQPAVATLMQLRGVANPARLLAIVPHYSADWATASTFLLTHYATKGDDGIAALEHGHVHALPLTMLAPFGDEAHDFARHAAANPAFFRTMAPWLLTAWPKPYADLDDLCTLIAPMSALPQPTIQILAVEERAHVATLRASAPGLAHVVGVAAALAPDVLRAELPWYAAWFGKHNQPVAGTAAIVAAFTDVAERTRLLGALAHTALRARLLNDKVTMAAETFAQLARVIVRALTLPIVLDQLEDALDAIAEQYEDDASELYTLLETSMTATVLLVVADAGERGADKAFIPWVLKRAASVISSVHFVGHVNAYLQYLCETTTPGVVLRTQTATTTSGTSNDILHIFDITAGNATGELHNHVSLITGGQTSLHFKNGGEPGPELSLTGPLAQRCRAAVLANPNRNTRFPDGYQLL